MFFLEQNTIILGAILRVLKGGADRNLFANVFHNLYSCYIICNNWSTTFQWTSLPPLLYFILFDWHKSIDIMSIRLFDIIKSNYTINFMNSTQECETGEALCFSHAFL